MDETNNLLSQLAAELKILRAICGHAHSAEAHKSHFCIDPEQCSNYIIIY